MTLPLTVCVLALLFGNVLRAMVLILAGWPLLFCGKAAKRYYLNLLIADDQGVNTICGGDPDETISSRIGKRKDGPSRFFARVVDTLFFWQPEHTRKSIEPDEGGNAVF